MISDEGVATTTTNEDVRFDEEGVLITMRPCMSGKSTEGSEDGQWHERHQVS
jgi:hypothetical protein